MKGVKCLFGIHKWKEIPTVTFAFWPVPDAPPKDALHYCEQCNKKRMRLKPTIIQEPKE